jgi:glycosyltransferase involved in cell wall biosynthesis
VRIVLIYQFFGPYHLARWKHWRHEATARGWTPLALQLFSKPDLYRWHPAEGQLTGFTNLGLKTAGGDRLRWGDMPRLLQALTRLKPDVVVVNGWGMRDAILIHFWCQLKNTCRIVVSDSQKIDFKRNAIKERFKRFILRGVEAAFAAGSPHREYLTALGIPRLDITVGCDVVDNTHFTKAQLDRKDSGYRILSVARLANQKNLLAAGRAFLRFLSDRPPHEPWTWSIAGYGPLQDELSAMVIASAGRIRLLGAVDYHLLPQVYADADLFWQPSLWEPWGLAVNEAMASGLPVLVSQACGCHKDLVNQRTGWTFDPSNLSDMIRALTVAADARHQWTAMGKAAAEHIRNWDLQRFSDGLNDAVQLVLEKRAAR